MINSTQALELLDQIVRARAPRRGDPSTPSLAQIAITLVLSPFAFLPSSPSSLRGHNTIDRVLYRVNRTCSLLRHPLVYPVTCPRSDDPSIPPLPPRGERFDVASCTRVFACMIPNCTCEGGECRKKYERDEEKGRGR